MAQGPAKQKTVELSVARMQLGTARMRLIGTTPMFQNRMANKAMQTLLVGGRKKSTAERLTIKHDPLSEFRNSAEILNDGPTALGLRVTAVKAAMCTAAIETEGVNRSSTQRLLFMPGDHCALYGVPQLRMDIVRSADPKHTPDVRTRAFIPHWCAEVEINFVLPQMSGMTVANLLWNAGILVGVGDFRQEKGKGAFGSFRVISDDVQDDEWDELVETQGRRAQMEALASPDYANQETADLMAFYDQEVLNRSASPSFSSAKQKAEKAAIPPAKKPNGRRPSATNGRHV